MFELEKAFAQSYRANSARLELARTFLRTDSTHARYVLGRNEQALACLKRVHVDGVIDDFAPKGDWNGVPVMSIDSVSKGALIVNCSTSIRPVSAHRRLTGVPGVRVLAYSDLMRVDSEVPQPDFVAAFRGDYTAHKDKWEWVGSLLGDEESRSVLNSLMLFRLTADYEYMRDFSVRFDEQYFDSIATLSESEVFVDCGGFDGDTVLQFCGRAKKYRHIYMFEPSEANVEKARRRLEDVANLDVISLGVSNENGTLSFDANGGSASAVSSTGSASINVVTLDDFIQREVTYIKMDLEGWELEALSGARRHILRDHPKLAIAVYHDSRDFWRVPEYVLSLRKDYAVYLRHYSEGWSETVMYFIPIERAQMN
jgi:FkbM family methyltransferase